MKKRNNQQVLVSLGVAILVLSLFFSSSLAKINGKESASRATVEITKGNVETWESETLVEAQKVIQTFLESQIVNPAASDKRIYQGNPNWTEGSLMALGKAYDSSQQSAEGVSSDLARMLLIKTVRKLEGASPVDQYDPTVTALNNYPDQEGNYGLEYNLPTVASLPLDKLKKYDIMFVLDWSGSVWDEKLPNLPGKNPLLHQAELVHTLSKHVIENYQGSRIWLLGYAANTSNAARLYIHANTGFFNDETDPAPAWQNKVTSTFPLNSNKPNPSEDNITGNLHDALTKMNDPLKGRDPKSIPVIVYMSDFQFKDAGSVPNSKVDYTNALDMFYRLPAADSTDPSTKPIYLAVRYDTNLNLGKWDTAAYNQLQDSVTTKNVMNPAFKRANWNWMAVNSRNAPNASGDFLKMFGDSLPQFPSRAYEAKINQKAFNYNSGSLISANNASAQATTSKNLSIKHAIDPDNGSYSVKFDESVSQPMGSTGTLLDASELTFNATDYQDYNRSFNGTPNLFYPYTEGAIEVYHYRGTGDKADQGNYELKTTVVGESFDAFGGAAFSLKAPQLSSMRYGKALTKAEALEITKNAITDAVFKKLDFSDPNKLIKDSQTMTFDAANNVYKLYAESNESSITLEYYDIDTKQPITGVTSDTLNGLVDELAGVTAKAVTDYEYKEASVPDLSAVVYTKENQTIKLYYQRTKATVKVHFVNDDGDEIDTTISLPAKTKDVVDLAKEAKVQDTIKKLTTTDLYELVPPGSEVVTVKPGDNVVTYIFIGKVSLTATPEMTFKTGVVSSRQQLLSYSSDTPFTLNVNDKRGQRTPINGKKRGQFQIFCSLTEPFVHGESQTELLNAKLMYNDGTIEQEISATGANVYDRNQVSADMIYDITLSEKDNKPQEKGLSLLVPKGSSIRKGTYNAEITWNLIEGP